MMLHRYHVHQYIWDVAVGEQLSCKRKSKSCKNSFAMGVVLWNKSVQNCKLKIWHYMYCLTPCMVQIENVLYLLVLKSSPLLYNADRWFTVMHTMSSMPDPTSWTKRHKTLHTFVYWSQFFSNHVVDLMHNDSSTIQEHTLCTHPSLIYMLQIPKCVVNWSLLPVITEVWNSCLLSYYQMVSHCELWVHFSEAISDECLKTSEP